MYEVCCKDCYHHYKWRSRSNMKIVCDGEHRCKAELCSHFDPVIGNYYTGALCLEKNLHGDCIDFKDLQDYNIGVVELKKPWWRFW